MDSDLIAYAMDFSSFLIQKTTVGEKIRNIIIFGSVARGEAGKESDVDIFIDVVKRLPALEKSIRSSADAFKLSSKYRNYWKPLGIENDIQLTIGQLSQWKELKPSIVSNGILLYGKFKPEIKEGTHRAFFIWENIKPNARRVSFNKKLFGHRQGGKFYNGMLQTNNGERVGKGCIAVPLENAASFQQLFRTYKISVRIRKVLEY
ncbi:nucleotidyltransferase domain-containing protein [Candidatus Woesearchaeota archaeon]|nr:nucleotidyltransferase domain-containing protein [Candidatus Woesearchaeota archaeon]